MARDFLFINVLNDRKLLRNLESLPDTVHRILQKKIVDWTERLYDEVLNNIQTRLKFKTGTLERGLRMEIVEDGLKVEGRVWIVGVSYAQAQEKGAVIPPHMIYAKNAKVMAFIAATGDKVFATRVFNPGAVIPPHYFMRDAYRYMSPRVTRELREQVIRGINEKMGL